MLKAVFVSDSGKTFVLGTDGGVAFDMDVGQGVPVRIGTTQGFSEIGETVETKSVGSKTINVTGCIYGDVAKVKRSMTNVFSPLTSGRLTINGKYYCDVTVKSSPSFSTKKNDGRFTMQFLSAKPFFYSVNPVTSTLGYVTPLFSFPVTYSSTEPHKFGERSVAKYINMKNTGDVAVPFSVEAYAYGDVYGVLVKNVNTRKYLEFTDVGLDPIMQSGDKLTIRRDEKGILRAEIESNGATVDALHYLNLSSDLFLIDSGDNLITAEDSGGGDALFFTTISFSPAVWSVFEE